MIIWRWTLGLAGYIAASTGPAFAQTAARVTASQPSVRTVRDLAQGWRFAFGAPASGPERTDFVDDSWAPVAVPHSWNRVGYYVSDPASHINRADTIDRSQGIGWYRLRFTPDAAPKGGRVWLEFDAASRIASVWLNGALLGEHKGGFSRFRFDATDAVRPDQPNILAVRVDNSEPKPGSTTTAVLPLKGDFFVHGGLYRSVRMVTTDPVHVDMRDSGGSGVFAVTDRLAGDAADVAVRTRVSNDAAHVVDVTVQTRLVDAQGKVAAGAQQRSRIATHATAEIAQRLTVPAAHLWQGVADPYLYRLVTEVRDARGRVLDRIDQAYGIRQMRFDPATGFSLNGKPLRLHGVGMHQDREGKGWGMTPADIESDVAILRDMGGNTIRREGDARDINTKGLVTFDRTIRKDAFYFYRANWSAAPTVHINGSRYVDRAYAVTDIRVYSNAPRTELMLNGRAIGTLDACPLHVCVWKTVRLAPCENRVIARGQFAGGAVEDAVSWRLADDTTRAFRIDSGALVAGDSASRFGSDAFFVGGTAATTDVPAGYGQPPKPAPITGTPDRMIAATYREGDFHYRLPLGAGRYEVVLTFVEPSAKPAERVFDVVAGGRTILPAIDIAASVPAPLAALSRTAKVTVTGNMLDLWFRPITGKAIVSAVDVHRID